MGSIIHAYEGTIEVEVGTFWGWGFADWQASDWGECLHRFNDNDSESF